MVVKSNKFISLFTIFVINHLVRGCKGLFKATGVKRVYLVNAKDLGYTLCGWEN